MRHVFPTRSARRARSQAGFTLVEMMIALLAGSFAIMAVYYLGGVSSRGFNEQSRVAESQMALRTAMEQLRRDISRAGYLAARDVQRELQPLTSAEVTPSGIQLQAVTLTYDGSLDSDTTPIIDAANNMTRIDRLSLVGNYSTGVAYKAADKLWSETIELDNTTEGFRNSFYDASCDGTAATFNPARFTAVFDANRWIRIETKSGVFFRQITSANAVEASPTITLATPLDPMTLGSWGVISPVDRIEYFVTTPEAHDELAALESTGGPGSARMVLARRERSIDPNDPDAIANTLRPVLDYAVEFSVDLVVDRAGGVGTPDFQPVSTAADVQAVSDTTPALIRSAIVTVASRTPEADPRIARVARTALTQPLMGWRIPGVGELFSRVRTLRTEIFLPNMASAR